MAADCVRIERLLYFGRDFLCGLDPAVLKLKLIAPSLYEYVSVVEAAAAKNCTSKQSSGDLPVSLGARGAISTRRGSRMQIRGCPLLIYRGILLIISLSWRRRCSRAAFFRRVT